MGRVKSLFLLSSVLAFAVAGASAELKTMPATHVPAAVSNGQAKRLRDLDPAKTLPIVLALPTRNHAQLDALLADLQNPSSPRYHQYLTPQQYTERFAATAADYAKVVAFARTNGISNVETTPNRHLVIGKSTVANINRVFHVTMGEYQHPTEARTFFSPDREPTVDLDVPLVEVGGLNNMALPHNKLRRPTPEQAREASARLGVGSGPDGQFLPSDMRAAYYGDGSLTGTGVSVAILGFGNYVASDLTLWTTNTGENLPVPLSDQSFSGSTTDCQNPGSTGCDDAEQTLDIEQVNGMAPGAKHIYFYAADVNSNTSDLTMMNAIATDDVAQIVSCSWGWGPTDQTTEDDSLMQMAAQGQTFLNATGDSGSYTETNISYPSVNPWTLEVGATSLVTAGPGGAWSAETGWEDSSGGYDPNWPSSVTYFTTYDIPAWQQLSGVVTTANKASSVYRNDPDVAAEGDFDNYVCDDGSCSEGYGGTSFAAPRWAGYLALVEQQSVTGDNGQLGQVNAGIYEIGTGSTYGTNFHDIVAGTNGSYTDVTGYDLVTGWGSPNGAGLTTALVPHATATNFSVSPQAPAVGQTVTLSATVTSAGSSYKPTGTLTFYYQSLVLGKGTVGSDGTVSITANTNGVAPGSYQLFAEYSGDGLHKLSAATQTVTLAKASSATTLSASPNPVTPPASVTLTATVARPTGYSGTPTGTVTFYYGNLALGSAKVGSNGKASITASTKGVGAGSYPVTAKYSGDTFDTASQSSAVTVTVQ